MPTKCPGNKEVTVVPTQTKEESMHTFSKNRQWQLGAFLASAFLLVLMQGCVSVNVGTTCPPSSGGGDPEPGACTKVTLVNPWNTDSNTFFTDGTAVPTGQTPPYRCVTGGKRCKTPQTSAGSCTLGGPKCKTWWLSSVTPGSRDGNCDCDCPNAYP
jgi:hypothetical protein